MACQSCGLENSPKILVAEDFEALRQRISVALENSGRFQLIHASDGLEAVRKFEELQPDLILLDIGLPKLNGLNVARRIRKLASDARILFLTQEDSADVVQEALLLGALRYVHKMSIHRDLLRGVEAVLRGEQFVSSHLLSSLRLYKNNSPRFRHVVPSGAEESFRNLA